MVTQVPIDPNLKKLPRPFLRVQDSLEFLPFLLATIWRAPDLVGSHGNGSIVPPEKKSHVKIALSAVSWRLVKGHPIMAFGGQYCGPQRQMSHLATGWRLRQRSWGGGGGGGGGGSPSACSLSPVRRVLMINLLQLGRNGGITNALVVCARNGRYIYKHVAVVDGWADSGSGLNQMVIPDKGQHLQESERSFTDYLSGQPK